MSKIIYYAHSISGNRIDGTGYEMYRVERIESGRAFEVQDDEKTEFYTEKHHYYFYETKKACEECAEANNDGAKENGNYGTAVWGRMKIDGEWHDVIYDYKNKTKTVFSNGTDFLVATISLETGEEIKHDYLNAELEKARKLIEEHDKLLNAITKKKGEGTV